MHGALRNIFQTGNIFSSEEYRQLLMSYRFIMGLLAVVLNGFFIEVLHKFPLKGSIWSYNEVN